MVIYRPINLNKKLSQINIAHQLLWLPPSKSQHGATNSGVTSSTFQKGYRFRGNASDASLFKAFVITSALALEGFKFVWLLEKQLPDPTLYKDDDGDA